MPMYIDIHAVQSISYLTIVERVMLYFLHFVRIRFIDHIHFARIPQPI